MSEAIPVACDEPAEPSRDEARDARPPAMGPARPEVLGLDPDAPLVSERQARGTVRVRYPRGWPPGWGRRPAGAALTGVIGVAVGGYVLFQLVRTDLAPAVAVPVEVVLGVIVAWSLVVAWTGVGDLGRSRVVTGVVVGRRVRASRVPGRRGHERFYVAVDDGTRARVRAWRVRRSVYDGCREGARVSCRVAPRVGWVRRIRAR